MSELKFKEDPVRHFSSDANSPKVLKHLFKIEGSYMENQKFNESFVIPTDDELYQCFFSFLRRWSKLDAQWVGRPLDDTPPLRLERGLLFSDPLRGMLVIRTSMNFDDLLYEIVNRSKNPSDSPDLFIEMVILFWHRFVSDFWKKDTRTLKPVLFKATVPIDWPDRRPDSATLVFVKNIPLEIRLWAPLSQDEILSWKKPPSSK
jgi:hypothetical protein